VYRKCHANHEKYNVYLERADEDLKFYVESSDSEDEDEDEDDDDSDEDSDDQDEKASKKRKATSDGSGGGGGSSSSSTPNVVVDLIDDNKKKKKPKKKLKIKKKSTSEEVCACKKKCGKSAPPALVPCYNKCGRGVKHMCGAAYCHEKNVSEQLEPVLSRTCRYCYKEVEKNILVGKYVGWEVEPKKEYIKAKVIKKTKKGYEIEFEDKEFANRDLSKTAILQLMEFYDKYLRM